MKNMSHTDDHLGHKSVMAVLPNEIVGKGILRHTSYITIEDNLNRFDYFGEYELISARIITQQKTLKSGNVDIVLSYAWQAVDAQTIITTQRGQIRRYLLTSGMQARIIRPNKNNTELVVALRKAVHSP